MTATPEPTAQEQWGLIKKEITGIQLVWELHRAAALLSRVSEVEGDKE
jgi:hypothetical protein